MADDLYTQWLQLPAGERPPNIYTLLGIEIFCSDAAKIEAAAQRQLDRLDPYAILPDRERRDACQDMMDAVARARTILIDPRDRQIYDQRLRKHLGLPEPVVEENDESEMSIDSRMILMLSGTLVVGLLLGLVVYALFSSAPEMPNIPDYSADFDRMLARIDAFELERKAMGDEVGDLRTEMTKLSGKFAQLRTDNASKADQIKELESQAIALRTKVDQLSARPGVAVVTPVNPVKPQVRVPIKSAAGMTMVPINVGAFSMGDRDSVRRVTLTRPFYMSATEITQAQWQDVMVTKPWLGKQTVTEGDDYPAVYVTWHDAVAFCEKLSRREGRNYRLPTEAEWEYACRGGTDTSYSFGNDESLLESNGWYRANAFSAGNGSARKAGSKKANAWGLYDMHGNVFEWCADWFETNPAAVIDPTGPASGTARVVRGGSWYTIAVICQSSYRHWTAPDVRSDDFGFRVVLESQ